ncbi:SAM-dependent methyltransferase [Chitinimonas arctica]|uniref:SAM-dependent methyltransferase n=1 Tax=Chitinimonas arctica TaxID=2594795 RepID=A0A516SFL0_9NEIS|nr:SAM-dependent methyltransferase [Chitinimonas arctica]QDQ26951.1 SAM-dependent methyltransferase [Chitinimonas arctica]
MKPTAERARTPEQTWSWLQTRPGLTALCQAYPAEWLAVRDELASVFARRQASELKALAERAGRRLRPGDAFLSGERQGRAFEAFVQQQVRQTMTELAVRQFAFSAATGVRKGKVRFNLFNGLIAQKLLFERDLQRKPVSLFWFRLLWPLVWQKRRLIPLVEKRGIYCFYSARLIDELVRLIAGRPCIEIAAGDGTLSRFLSERGVAIQASDDGSWGEAAGSQAVSRMDARDALKLGAPAVVLCSWPPANNPFERQVFRTRSVQTYIVIGSRSQFITGNWADYLAQTGFSLSESTELSRLVLPPELGAAVYVFNRA